MANCSSHLGEEATVTIGEPLVFWLDPAGQLVGGSVPAWRAAQPAGEREHLGCRVRLSTAGELDRSERPRGAFGGR